MSNYKNYKLFTMKERLLKKRNLSIIVSISFSIFIIVSIILYALYYQRNTEQYFDDIAETRIQNSGRQLKEIVSNRLDDGFMDAIHFKDCVQDEEISTSGKLDYDKLYETLDYYSSSFLADDVGVLIDKKIIISKDNQLDYPYTSITSNSIVKINDTICFIVPNTNNTLIDAVVATVSCKKINELLTTDIYNKQASVMICAHNGDNVIVGDYEHEDTIRGNCIEDVSEFYPSDDADEFKSIFQDDEIHVAHLNADIPVMLYKAPLSYGNEDGNFVLLFFAPRSVLTDQLNQLNTISVSALYTVLIIASILLITLYLLFMHTKHTEKAKAAYNEATTLLNSDSFFHDAQAILLKKESDYALVSLNIQGFTKLNSIYGSYIADEVLTKIGELLHELLKEEDGDLPGYANADNFMLLLRGNKDDIVFKVSGINDALTHYEYPNNIQLQFSFGIKMITQADATKLRSEYDCAKFAERHRKTNDYLCFYDNEFTRKQKETENLISRFDEAIEKKEFEVHIQLKWDIKKSSWGGAEALVRWRDPIKGLIPPGIFIPIFEENGYITRLDKYVLEGTCKYLADMLDQGEECVPVSVNLSKRNFADLSFFNEYEYIINKYKIPHDLIQFEITEGLFIDNISSYKEFVSIIHKNGYSIAMDDFGAGYSSLNLIHELDFDVIKLDGKFFRQGLDESNKIIISTIIRLCHELGKKVVAEGVEEAFEVEFLRNVNCDYIQGYYYSRPSTFLDAKALYLKK